MKRILFFVLLLALSAPLNGFAQQNCNITIQGMLQQPSCSGGMDGAIQAKVVGGIAPYTYNWSDGQTLKDITNLTSGNYTLTVRDSRGCIAKADFSLTDKKEALKLLVEQKTIQNKQHVLQVAFEGGKKPYAITIKKLSNGIRAPNLPYKGEGLSDGIYLLEAFTEAGCSVMQKVLIDAK